MIVRNTLHDKFTENEAFSHQKTPLLDLPLGKEGQITPPPPPPLKSFSLEASAGLRGCDEAPVGRKLDGWSLLRCCGQMSQESVISQECSFLVRFTLMQVCKSVEFSHFFLIISEEPCFQHTHIHTHKHAQSPAPPKTSNSLLPWWWVRARSLASPVLFSSSCVMMACFYPQVSDVCLFVCLSSWKYS